MKDDLQLILDLKYLSNVDHISTIYCTIKKDYMSEGLDEKEAIKVSLMDIISKL